MPRTPFSRPAAKVVLVAVLVAAGSGLAFAGWVNNGAQIIMSMAQTGLAWCF